MDGASRLLLWALAIVAGVVAITVVALGSVIVWNQRRAIQQARRWGQLLIKAQDVERARIAAELHDDIIQRISGVQMSTERLGHEAEVECMGQIIADLRTLSHDLHPPTIGDEHIRDAIRDLADRQFEGGTPIVVLELDAGVIAGPDQALALYRVAQEGLTNVLRHAEADSVKIELATEFEEIVLKITDDGIGLSESVDTAESFGFRSMRERMYSVAGKLEIRTAEGGGTTLMAKVPRK